MNKFEQLLEKKIEHEANETISPIALDENRVAIGVHFENVYYKIGANLLAPLLIECYEKLKQTRHHVVGFKPNGEILEPIDDMIQKLESFVKDGQE